MFGSIFSGLVTLITKPIADWSERKTLEAKQKFELEKLEHEAKVAIATTQLEMAKAGQQIDFQLDQMSMQEMAHSWKDEFVLLVFISPMMMAFVPQLSAYALKGFEVIASMPEWYRYIIIGMVIVIYGLRGLVTKLIESKLNIKG